MIQTSISLKHEPSLESRLHVHNDLPFDSWVLGGVLGGVGVFIERGTPVHHKPIPRLHARNELSGTPEERKFGAYIAAVCGQSTQDTRNYGHATP